LLLQDQPKKKAKVSSKGRSLVDFLPAPKQDLAAACLGTAGIKVLHHEHNVNKKLSNFVYWLANLGHDLPKGQHGDWLHCMQ